MALPRKPFDMLIAVAPQVQHTVALEEHHARLHPCLQGARTEISELLTLRLAGLNSRTIQHELTRSETHPVRRHALLHQAPKDLGERQGAVEGGSGELRDGGGIHGGAGKQRFDKKLLPFNVLLSLLSSLFATPVALPKPLPLPQSVRQSAMLLCLVLPLPCLL